MSSLEYISYLPRSINDDLFKYVSSSLLESHSREILLDIPDNGLLSQLDDRFISHGYSSNTMRFSTGHSLSYEDNRAVYLFLSDCKVIHENKIQMVKLGTLLFSPHGAALTFKSTGNVMYLITFFTDHNVGIYHEEATLHSKLEACKVKDKSYDYWEEFIKSGPYPDLECYRYLLNAAPSDSVRQQMISYHEGRPLRDAASKGYLYTVMYLHSVGGNIDDMNYESLKEAVVNGHLPVVMYIMSVLDEASQKAALECCASRKLLEEALKRGDWKVTMYLLQVGADMTNISPDLLDEVKTLHPGILEILSDKQSSLAQSNSTSSKASSRRNALSVPKKEMIEINPVSFRKTKINPRYKSSGNPGKSNTNMASLTPQKLGIFNRRLNLPYSHLVDLIDAYGRKTVELTLARFISEGRLEYPLKRVFMTPPLEIVQPNGPGPRSYFKEEPYIDTLEQWLSYNTHKFKGKEIILYHVNTDYDNFDIITDYFTEYARIKARAGKFGPPIESWKYRDTALKIARYVIEKVLDKKTLLDTKMLEGGIYSTKMKMATTFRLSLGIKMYEFFKASFVFDPFAGWGDRAIAATLTPGVERYIGTDPNTDLQRGYTEILDFSKTIAPNKDIQIFDKPIEDLDLNLVTSKGQPDLIFSSPPFYTYEIYADEPTQSVNRFPDADKWLNGWFLPQMIRVWDILKVGGYMVLYLGDSRVSMSSSLIEAMKKERGDNSDFLGAIPTYHEYVKFRPVFFYIWKKI